MIGDRLSALHGAARAHFFEGRVSSLMEGKALSGVAYTSLTVGRCIW